MSNESADRLAIVETVNNWALWRDAGDWERFRTVWHEDGWMTATWFQGPAAKFIEVSKAGFDKVANLSGGMLRWRAQRFGVEGGTD